MYFEHQVRPGVYDIDVVGVRKIRMTVEPIQPHYNEYREQAADERRDARLDGYEASGIEVRTPAMMTTSMSFDAIPILGTHLVYRRGEAGAGSRVTVSGEFCTV